MDMNNSNLTKLTDDQIDHLKPKDFFILDKNPYTFSGHMHPCRNPVYKLMAIIAKSEFKKDAYYVANITDDETDTVTIGELSSNGYQADSVSQDEMNTFNKLLFQDELDECKRLMRIHDNCISEMKGADGRIFSVLVDMLRKSKLTRSQMPSDEIQKIFDDSRYHDEIPIISSSFNIDEFISSNAKLFE